MKIFVKLIILDETFMVRKVFPNKLKYSVKAEVIILLFGYFSTLNSLWLENYAFILNKVKLIF